MRSRQESFSLLNCRRLLEIALKISGWEGGLRRRRNVSEDRPRFLRWGEGLQPLFAALGAADSDPSPGPESITVAGMMGETWPEQVPRECF